jgi:predicted transcriptional regulator
MRFPHVSDDNPFKVLSPGVESDVLCILGRSPMEHSASNIADLTNRSRSQVHMVLLRLVQHELVLRRVLEGWSGYRLNPQHPLTEHVKAIAQLRVELVTKSTEGA